MSDEEAEPVYNTIANTEHNYILADTDKKISDLISILKSAKEYCYDSETTGLDTLEAELVGLSFAVKAHEAYYVPIPAEKDKAQAIVEKFRPIFEDENKILVGQNIKYDYQVLKNYNVIIKNKFWDTMVAHFLIQPDMRHNMNVLSETYLNYEPVSIEELIGKKGKNQTSMRDVPVEQIKDYAAEDADVTIQRYFCS